MELGFSDLIGSAAPLSDTLGVFLDLEFAHTDIGGITLVDILTKVHTW